MYRVLVDKDHIMPAKEDTSEERYWVKKPTEREFQCTCMDFWWCFNNVAKEVSRELGFQYDQENADNSTAFLRRVKDLPLDAERIM